MSDMRYLLKGSRTFLWDFPEFLPLPSDKEIIHVGPIAWGRWPYDKVNIPEVAGSGYPLAVVAFGTCVANIDVMKRIVRLLRELGYEVLIAGGGQKELLNMCDNEKRVSMYEYAPLQMILPHASLVVSHGGQMTVFEALQSSTPVLVMPFQPEQAHSGVCLERMGCGARLIPPQPFQGDPAVYINAFNRMTDNEIKSKILRLTGNPQIKDRLSAVSEIIHQYRGAEQLASMLEDA
jgi:UDP:flavonoid glycosyltransferase YjiC (YdhE family)